MLRASRLSGVPRIARAMFHGRPVGSSQTLIMRSSFSSLPEHTVVAMPSLSPTMESGSISKWNLSEGDAFEDGTAMCEVETDKATVTFDATDAGYIAKILVGEGEIKVGQPIMVTVEDASDVAAFKDFKLDAAPPAVAPSPASSPAAPSKPAANASTPASALSSPPVAPPTAPESTSSGASSSGRIFASPLAKKMAKESSISLADVTALLGAGSGGNGRIVAADILKAAAMPKPDSATQSEPASSSESTSSAAAPAGLGLSLPSGESAAGGGVYADFELSEMSRSIAAQLTLAKQIVPHYYLSVDLDLTQLLALRAFLNSQLSATAGKGKEPKSLSVLDFMVKAAALAMKQVPDVNAAWMDTFVRRYDQVDINLVMSTGAYQIAPVIRDVGGKGVSTISDEVASFEDTLFADDETASAISPETLAQGTFSIHNLGIYGVKSSAPIVSNPQACALSLGAIIDTVVPAQPKEEDGENWKVAPVMCATLSCDHRVVDGAVGAQWLAAYKTLVENPQTMLL